MQLITVFPEILCEIFLIDLFEVVKVVRAFRVHAFMDDKVLAVFFMNQRMAAVRTIERIVL